MAWWTVCCFSLIAGVAAGDGLDAVRTLKIDQGEVVSAVWDTSPQLAESPQKIFKELPPRGVVKIHLAPAKGSNINVEIWLPERERWNGRFIGLGNGGAAGRISSGQFGNYVRNGYAVATTDMGTSPNSDSGIGNREVWRDFGYRATHLMTVVAKQVIASYYGRSPELSYFLGGSTGGQQALQEAQRYPGDYDGIVANVPAHCRTPLHAYFLWNYQIFRRTPFTPEQERNVTAAGIEYLAGRELPQTAGKMVSDPRCTQEDIAGVIALARQKDPSLTDAHAEALRKLFDGPRHEVTGERIFDGVPVGSTFDIARGHLYLFQWVFGKDVDLMKLDFGKDFDRYNNELGPLLNAENPDLRPFAARGGKLIIISGSADACVPFHATLDYYERVAACVGSLEKTQEFCRFYLIPGMSHGPGPGLHALPGQLGMIVDWREKGIAPWKIPGARYENGQKVLELPLFPYPEKTAFDQGAGFHPVTGPRGGVGRSKFGELPPQ